MLPRSLDKIDEAFLQSLCADKCPESSTLEFKQELPPSSAPDSSMKILKEIVALANSEGGDVTYGVAEENGVADRLVALAESPDGVERRLRSLIDTVEPRVQGVLIQAVAVSGGNVYVVRVPSSFDGPHSIKVNGTNRRFVMRHGTITSDMSYEQLRVAFGRTETLIERARRLHASRRQAILEEAAPLPLSAGPLLMVQCVPLAGLAGRVFVDVAGLRRGDLQRYQFDDWDAVRQLLNADGLLVFERRSQEAGHEAYVQVNRQGAWESVHMVGGELDGGGRIVVGAVLAGVCRQAVAKFLRFCTDTGITGPALVALSLLNVRGLSMSGLRGRGAPCDRAVVDLPEGYFAAVEGAHCDEVVRAPMDVLWQAFDVDRCPHYDGNGDWVEPK